MQFNEKQIVENNILCIEKEYDVKVLCGSFTGSKMLNLNNQTSDLDFYFIYTSTSNRSVSGKYSFNDKLTPNFIVHKKYDYGFSLDWDGEVNFMGYDLSAVKNSTQRYNDINLPYPRYHYKTSSLDDDGQFFFFRILSSKYIWINDKFYQNCDDIVKTFIKINILDYFYTRACGNYDNFLQGEQVQVRKYLYTFHEIFCIMWIFKYETMPNMDFLSLLSDCLDEEDINRELCCLWKANRKEKEKNKKLLLINKNTLFNNFIFNKLLNIREKISFEDASKTNTLIRWSIFDYICNGCWLERTYS